LVDGQAFLPRRFYPQVLIDVVDWYANTFKDKLMTHPVLPWFSSIVALEVLFQLPFFFVAVRALLQHDGSTHSDNNVISGSGLFRSFCIIYASSTATTLVPILGCILSDDDTTMTEKGVLLGFYLPYLVFPLWLVVIAVCENDVFGDIVKNKSK
jgi:hypothetical protein